MALILPFKELYNHNHSYPVMCLEQKEVYPQRTFKWLAGRTQGYEGSKEQRKEQEKEEKNEGKEEKIDFKQ